MTSAILHEAGFEPLEGEEAVAEVILNRLRSPAFPKTICGVVFQGSERRTGCQFSFTCDGSIAKTLPAEATERARLIAARAIDGLLTSHIPGATHYHADYVSPAWAPSLVRVGSIGRHIFYRQPGALPFSSLARYDPSGERMPSSLNQRPLLGASSDSAEASAAPPKAEPFTLWGFDPAALQHRQSTSKR